MQPQESTVVFRVLKPSYESLTMSFRFSVLCVVSNLPAYRSTS